MEKLETNIADEIKQSLKSAPGISDCVKFSFDVKIFSVEGQFCKNGMLEATITILGVKIQHIDVDLKHGKFCNTVSIGVEEVKYCFYLKDNCLYTSGYVDGWLHKKYTWDEKIICI